MLATALWADDDREGLSNHCTPCQPDPANRRRQLARAAEKIASQNSTATRAPPTQTDTSTAAPATNLMEVVRLTFLERSGGLRPGGPSQVIPGPTYYRSRARSAINSGHSSRSLKSGAESEWRYFNSELSNNVNNRSVDDKKVWPHSTRQSSQSANMTTTQSDAMIRSNDLNKQRSLSNRLLNVTTIDDYQERYLGQRVTSDSRYGHSISRASSASTRTQTPAIKPYTPHTISTRTQTPAIKPYRPHSAKTDTRSISKVKRPTSSKTESGIYDVQSESEYTDKVYATENPLVNMPLEYYALLEKSADSRNATISKGFHTLLDSNKCLLSTSSKLYRDVSPVELRSSTGSEFFRRLNATLRYQLLMGEGLPSKHRAVRAISMHSHLNSPALMTSLLS